MWAGISMVRIASRSASGSLAAGLRPTYHPGPVDRAERRTQVRGKAELLDD